MTQSEPPKDPAVGERLATMAGFGCVTSAPFTVPATVRSWTLRWQTEAEPGSVVIRVVPIGHDGHAPQVSRADTTGESYGYGTGIFACEPTVDGAWTIDVTVASVAPAPRRSLRREPEPPAPRSPWDEPDPRTRLDRETFVSAAEVTRKLLQISDELTEVDDGTDTAVAAIAATLWPVLDRRGLEPGSDEDLANALLDVLDAFEFAARSDADAVLSLHPRVLALATQFGIEPFGRVGELFDPHHHNAIGHRAAHGAAGVTEVHRTGYRWRGQLLRAADVTVVGTY